MAIGADGEVDFFGERDPRHMSLHFFQGNCGLNYESAVKADVSKQNYAFVPRHWYIDMTARCESCGQKFSWTAKEQQVWFETYGIFVDSYAKRCLPCRREQRRARELRQEYDQKIASVLACDTLEEKERLAEVIDRLCESLRDLPVRIHENRQVLGRQIERRRRMCGQ